MKKRIAAALIPLLLGAMQAPTAEKPLAPLSLWRLDCGDIVVNDFNARFSDTMAYRPGQSKTLVASCYLIKHGDQYMLWDTGLTAALIGHPRKSASRSQSLNKTIVDQLKQLNVRPDQIGIVGISHYHSDHIGQAASFPGAKLMIGKSDFDALKAKPVREGLEPDLLQPWIEGGAPVAAVESDTDIFGDGRVVMLRTPGHTPGHNALLVRLASGNILLTGDIYHFTEQVRLRGVPPVNANRADTLASMDRIDGLARNLHARMIIQHEPADVAKLPAFPRAAQ